MLEINENQISKIDFGRKLRILVVFANHGGCAYYRALMPFSKLQELYGDKVEVRFNDDPLGVTQTNNILDPNYPCPDIKWADVVLINNILKFGGPYTARVCGIAKEMGKFVHFDTDDLLTELYDEHKLYEVYETNKLDEITKSIYNYSDLVSVTQEKFAKRIMPYVSKILCVIKNCIDYDLPCWRHEKVKTRYTKIGWAGGIHHAPDVKVFRAIPHLVNQKVGRENVKWDFYGAPPPDSNKKADWQDDVWPEYKRALLAGFKGQKNYQIHYAAPPNAYGVFYSNMDIAIAPLEMNAFNDSKSDIKVAEAGRYKVPLIASNVGCYSDTIKNGETGYLIDPDAPKSEWVRILTKVCKDKKHREEMGENLHKITEQLFNANKVIGFRLAIYERAFKDLGYKLDDKDSNGI